MAGAVDDHTTCLCWGSIEGAGLLELAAAAAATGFETISVTPAMFVEALESGVDEAGLRRRLDDLGIGVAMIDPLMRGLPGVPGPGDVGRRFRSTFLHGEATCLRAAEALGATAVNVAHFLGKPTPVTVLTDHIGALAERTSARGVGVLVEFMPEGAIPDLATALAIVEGVGGGRVALTLDTWHLARIGAGADDVAALPPGTIGAVQIADGGADIIATWTEPPTAERLLPGAGVLPLEAIVTTVVGRHRGAVLGVEVFDRSGAGDPPDARAGRLRAALTPLLASAAQRASRRSNNGPSRARTNPSSQ